MTYREQDKPGYKPGLWACMTGNLIILVIITITDIYFYFCNKKQARGELIIEPVEGTDSSVGLVSNYRSRALANYLHRTSSGTPTEWRRYLIMTLMTAGLSGTAGGPVKWWRSRYLLYTF